MRRSICLFIGFGCLGCVGDSGTNPPIDAGPQPDTFQPVEAAPGPDTSAPVFSIGGDVHFLQASGADAGAGLVLSNNGKDPVNITKSGKFVFPAKASNYDVTVITHPPGQVCGVRNASGKGSATADVTNIVVGCTIAMQSSGGTANVTTNSKTATAIQGVNPISFSTDLPGKALVSLMVPSVGLNTGSFDDVLTAIQLDGSDVTTGRFGNQNNIGQGAHTIYAVVDVPAGAHTIGATWHTLFNFGSNTATAYAPFPIQLDVIVLDSLSTFSSAASGTGAASANNNSTAMIPMMADVAFTTNAPSPVLALLQAPNVVVSSASNVSLAVANLNLSTDTGLASTGKISGASQDAAPLLVALPTLSAGAHQLKAAWANTTASSSYSVAYQGAPHMDAIVFTPAAHTASSQLNGDQTTSLTNFVSVPNLAPLSLTAGTATKALVIMHIDASAGGSDKYAAGEFTVALDNKGVNGGVAATTSNNPLAAYPLTFIQLVDVDAGPHTFQAQFRAKNLDVHTGSGTTTLTAILIE